MSVLASYFGALSSTHCPTLTLECFSFLICLYVVLILLYVYDAREVVGVHVKFKIQHA